MSTKWYKWRVHWAWGITDWKYIRMPDNCGYSEKEIGTYLDDHNMLENFSDKWRRVEWDLIDKPSLEVVKQMAINMREAIKDSKKQIEELNEFQKEYENEQRESQSCDDGPACQK